MTSPVAVLADYRRGPVIRTAVETFFAAKELRPNSRRGYQQTLDALGDELGWEIPINRIEAEAVGAAFLRRWGHDQGAMPSTWNTHRIRARSLMAFCERRNWITDEPMVRVEPGCIERDETKAIPLDTLAPLWCRRDIDLWEKTMWRMLYETAALASEVLALNIEDLDLSHNGATIIGKGGHRQRIHWASGTDRLLPRYLAGRRRGSVFVTHRKPQAILPARDLCPGTGLAR